MQSLEETESDCHYGEAEFSAVRTGREAVTAVLEGDDLSAELS